MMSHDPENHKAGVVMIVALLGAVKVVPIVTRAQVLDAETHELRVHVILDREIVPGTGEQTGDGGATQTHARAAVAMDADAMMIAAHSDGMIEAHRIVLVVIVRHLIVLLAGTVTSVNASATDLAMTVAVLLAETVRPIPAGNHLAETAMRPADLIVPVAIGHVMTEADLIVLVMTVEEVTDPELIAAMGIVPGATAVTRTAHAMTAMSDQVVSVPSETAVNVLPTTVTAAQLIPATGSVVSVQVAALARGSARVSDAMIAPGVNELVMIVMAEASQVVPRVMVTAIRVIVPVMIDVAVTPEAPATAGMTRAIVSARIVRVMIAMATVAVDLIVLAKRDGVVAPAVKRNASSSVRFVPAWKRSMTSLKSPQIMTKTFCLAQ